jgi:hypothetical protein
MASVISINRIAIASIVLAMAAAPLPARAQSTPAEKQAQALQVEGLRLMQKGDNRHALEKFEEAFRLIPSPRILFNRAKAHRALGEDVEALSDFERFLDEAPFAPKESRDDATRNVEALRPRLAYLEIQTDDAGSAVTVDGREIGTAPLARPVVVARGKHEIRVAKAGMADDVRSVSVIPGQKLRVVVRLAPVAEKAPAPVSSSISSVPAPSPAPPAASPAAATAGSVAPAPLAAADGKPVEVIVVQPPRPWQITAAWVAAGAGALFLGGGIAAQVSSSSKSAEFNNLKDGAGFPQCTTLLPDDGGGQCKGLNDAAHQRLVLAIVGYAAAGVAFGTSLVLFLTAPSQPASRQEAVATCSPTNSGVSCALTLTF